jgi:hypothetical protein
VAAWGGPDAVIYSVFIWYWSEQGKSKKEVSHRETRFLQMNLECKALPIE